MSMAMVESEIRAFIVRNFPLSARSPEIGLDESLVGTGVIDSAGVLELVEFIETRFDLTVPFGDLTPESFDSIGNIIRYVSSHAAAAASDAA